MSILDYINGYLNGIAWEELCVECYRMRYQSEHYTPISANQGGDGGIEGFTQSGVVNQCYCPEKLYEEQKLYEHLRQKMKNDIDKLLEQKYQKRLFDLGVPPIYEWHFVIPEQKDSRLLRYANEKRKEVLEAKGKNPDAYPCISDDFKIIIKCAEDFKLEIGRLVLTPHRNFLLNLKIMPSDSIDYTQCESEKAKNITRKMKAIKMTEEDTEDTEFLIKYYIKAYLQGIDILNDLRLMFPDIHKTLIELEQSCKEDAAVKTRLVFNASENSRIFVELLDGFENKLKEQFSNVIDVALIKKLKQDLVASWLADCSMEFRK
jgi:hypothetical protein